MGIGVISGNFGLLGDNPNFDTSIQDWWGRRGTVNIGTIVPSGGSVGLLVQQEGGGYTTGLNVVALTTDDSGIGAGAAALNIDTFGKSAVDAPNNRIWGIDCAVGNFGPGRCGTLSCFVADGIIQPVGGPVTNWIGFYVIDGNYPSVDNAYGVFVGDVAAATNNFAIKTGAGRVQFGDIVIMGTTIPADGDLAANEICLYLDPTNGAGKLKIKAKTANGTVVTGSVALT